jgi:hypothetical protein
MIVTTAHTLSPLLTITLCAGALALGACTGDPKGGGSGTGAPVVEDEADDGGAGDGEAADGEGGGGEEGGAADGEVDAGDAGDGGAGSGGGGDSGDDCESNFDFWDPRPGSVDHYFIDPITISVTDGDPSATVSLRLASGEPVEGEVVPWEYLGLQFVPAAPLRPLTTYEIEASVCRGLRSRTARFTTSADGAPLAVDITGQTYDINFNRARLWSPSIIGLFVSGFDTDLLLQVEGVDSEAVRFAGAQAERAPSPEQDHCRPSVSLPPAQLYDPYFVLGPAPTTFWLPDFPFPMLDMQLTGVFLADGTSFVDGRMSGVIDLREVEHELLEGYLGLTDLDEVCTFLREWGSPCQACASDGEARCFPWHVISVEGRLVDAPLTCVDEAECHPLCATSTCEDPAAGECL